MPFLLAKNSVDIIVPAGQKICVTSYGAGTATIETATEPANYPAAFSLLTSITNSDYTSSAFTRDTIVKITAGLCEAEYIAGVNPFPTIHRVTTDGNGNILLDSSVYISQQGNLGVGITPVAWGNGVSVQGDAWAISTTTGPSSAAFTTNARQTAYGGATQNYVYRTGGAAASYLQSSGGHFWYIAPTGVAGNPVTFTQAMTVDNSGRLLVGPAASQSLNNGTLAGNIQVESNSSSGITVVRNSSNASSGVFAFGKSRGTAFGSRTSVASGDALGNVSFDGADGTNYIQAATISAVVDSAPGANSMPGRIVFSTTPSGSTTPAERMRIDSAGNVGVGVTPAARLDVLGAVRLRTGLLNGMVLGADSYAAGGTTTDSVAKLVQISCVHYLNAEEPVGVLRAQIESTSSTISIGSGSSSLNNVTAFDIWLGTSNATTNGNIRFSVKNDGIVFTSQLAPDAVNATATLTTANLSQKIITSTTAAAVTATLPTGTLMDGAFGTVSDLAFEWTVINTGPNAFTLAAGASHTIVGNAAVATNTSGTFRSRRTGAATWVSYRI